MTKFKYQISKDNYQNPKFKTFSRNRLGFGNWDLEFSLWNL